MRQRYCAFFLTWVFVSLAVGQGAAATLAPGTLIISNDFESETSLGPGTDPALFGTVSAANLPVNKPTGLVQTGTGADADVMTSNLGFGTQHGEIYSGSAASGYRVSMSWNIQPLAISNGLYHLAWNASAAQTARKGGHLYITAGNSYSFRNIFDLWFTSGGKFTVTGVTSNFAAYAANTPLAFALDLNMGATNFNLAINGVRCVTNGSLQGLVATNLIGAINFETYVLLNGTPYDNNQASFGIDNLTMAVPVPAPRGTVVCFR